MTPTLHLTVNKLIRDKIPAIMEANGVTLHQHVMEDVEFAQRLKDKLVEEAQEVFESKNAAEMTEELADVLEVITTLARVHNITFEEIQAFQAQKRTTKGSFEGRVYGDYIEIDEGNPKVEFYKARFGLPN